MVCCLVVGWLIWCCCFRVIGCFWVSWCCGGVVCCCGLSGLSLLVCGLSGVG